MIRLAILTSHPVQYYAPLFCELARRIDLHVFFAHKASAEQQGDAGFGTPFSWDIDLESGYSHSYLRNVARSPHASHFLGCDTPDIGDRLREGKFEVVLSLGWHLKSLLQGIWAAKQQKLPVMIRGDSQPGITSSKIRNAVKEIAYPGLLRNFDAALYVGERNRAYYRQYRYPDDRLFHSPHAIDTERFERASADIVRNTMREQLGLGPDDRAVLFAGKLLPFKRPLDAVLAVAKTRAAGLPTTLVIAGSGPLDVEVAAAAKRLAVPTKSLGFVNQLAMPRVYAAADALMLPSNGRETWGLVCNEALACGVPLVISDEVGCAPDLGADGLVGRTYPGGQPVVAGVALCNLFSVPPSSEAIRSVSQRYSLARAADGVIAACDHVVRRVN